MAKRLIAAATMVALALGVLSTMPAEAAAPKAGAACTKLSQVVTANYVKYQCVKSGTKKVWKRIGVVAKPTPKPTASASPSPAPVFNQTASDANLCKLPQASARNDVYAGWPRNSDRTPSIGKVRYAVIFVDFSDKPARETPEQNLARISPTVEQEFLDQSGGKFELTFVPLLKWLRMPAQAGSYSFKTFESHRSYIADAMRIADPSFDFANIDGVLVMNDPNQAAISYGPALVARAGSGIVVDGREIRNAATSGTDLLYWGARWANHEMSHNLGLADLYAYSGETQRFMGAFSYMGLINGAAPGLTAWERWSLGWLTDSQVICDPVVGQQFQLDRVSTTVASKARMAVIKINQYKALVLETRTSAGIDRGLGDPGVLAYTVDGRVTSGEGPIQVVSKLASNYPNPANSLLRVGESVTVDGRTVSVFWQSGDSFGIKVTK